MSLRGRERSSGYKPPVKVPSSVAARPPQSSSGPRGPVVKPPAASSGPKGPVVRPPQASSGPKGPSVTPPSQGRGPVGVGGGATSRGPSPAPPASFLGGHVLGDVDDTLQRPTPNVFRPTGLGAPGQVRY